MAAADTRIRRRPAPERTVDGQVVVARADLDAALVLPATAAQVWQALAAWRSPEELARMLAEHHPEVDEAERAAALASILDQLDAAGLLERAA